MFCIFEEKNLIAIPSGWNIEIYDLKTGIFKKKLEGHSGHILMMIKLQDGRLASAASDNTIRIWNIMNRKCEVKLKTQQEDIWGLNELSSSILVSGAENCKLYFWDLDQEKCILTKQSQKQGIIYVIISFENQLIAHGEGHEIQILKYQKSKDTLKIQQIHS